MARAYRKWGRERHREEAGNVNIEYAKGFILFYKQTRGSSTWPTIPQSVKCTKELEAAKGRQRSGCDLLRRPALVKLAQLRTILRNPRNVQTHQSTGALLTSCRRQCMGRRCPLPGS
jgi:hypothetical protein